MSFAGPAFIPSVTLLGVSDVITSLKTVASRNQLMSKTSVNQGFETNATVGPYSGGLDTTYATSTSVSGTLSYPQSLITYQSRWTTILTVNEGSTPGTTVVSVNGGAYSATDETILYTKNTGVGTDLKLCQFQVPIGVGNLTSVSVTFNKASSTSETNAQQVYILPGKWSGVSNSYYAGGFGGTSSHSSTSLAVNQNDLVFIHGGLDRTDAGIPTIGHGGPANTRVIESNFTYGGKSRQMALHTMDAAGTFTSDTGYTSVTTGGGGGHSGGGGTTTYYYYSNLVQSMRFVQP
jgi:hypothetical protein